MIRDSWKLYEHLKSFLSPLFVKTNRTFADWCNFELLKDDECRVFGVDRIIGFEKNEKVYYIQPQEIAGDFFRLICVLTLALGIITNNPREKEKCIIL